MTVLYGDGREMGYIRDITTPAAIFMGEYDSNTFYDYGAITMRNGEAWIYTGSTWECLGVSNSLETNEVKEYVTNCPNCGAPMRNHKCMYCGTEDYGRR